MQFQATSQKQIMLNKLKIPKELRKIIDKELETTEEYIKWIEQPRPSLFTNKSFRVFRYGVFGTVIAIMFVKDLLGDLNSLSFQDRETLELATRLFSAKRRFAV